MKKTVLLYHFSLPRQAQVRMALSRLPFEVRPVKKEEYLLPLGCLAGLDAVPSFLPPYEGPGTEDEMVVFAGALGDELDEVLLAFRKNGLTGIGLKAVLTASNKSWTSLQLYEELKRERAAMKR